ncbi:hypothetical protein CK203_057205 [Vitis vinifera]|uniref:Transposase-associated domain-containing protein n=1 Tax=Vitis vinifera TaxID=29760 RepID=A0A438GKX1_VITVI|nr:hypothetical protein CK203_057205 [Vitis vinifera]
MPIDKSWIQKSRVSSEYYQGVLEFLDFAFSNALGKEMLPCPCIRCNNCLMQKREIMYDHLLDNGIARNYVRWLMHGEYEFCEPTNTSTNESDMHDEMQEMLNDAFGMPMPNEESERSRHGMRTSHMKWHVDGRMEGEMMRHPVDSLAWKNFDNVHPSFALEPRNVRLGLASDGFNPFGNMSISYSMWPVFLFHITYHLGCVGVLKGNLLVLFVIRIVLHSITKRTEMVLHGSSSIFAIDHRFRRDKKSFDGNEEHRAAPKQLSGEDVLHQLDGMEHITLGKTSKNKIIVGTLLSIDGKSKDNFNSRLDLQAMGIRDQLHPIQRGNRVILPAACYSLTSNEKKEFCKFLKEVKVPDGYASNISRCVQVNERKIFGLKSHDCHVLMQQLLPLAIRGVLHKNVCAVIVELCSFFKQLCSKVLKTDQLEHLENDIIVTLCKLERIFPPSFFDVMVHLPIHLASEAKVVDQCNIDGCILSSEGYIAEECTTFCSRYLHDVETKHDREERNYVIENNITNGGGLTIFKCMGRTIGKSTSRVLSTEEWSQAHLYVLTNCEEVTSFIEEHKQSIRVKPRIRARDVDLIHTREFISWFEERIIQMRHEGPISEHILSLSRGPSTSVTCYRGYIINGFRFHTREREKGKKTQNSGVVVTAEVSSFASARDKNPIPGHVSYYGVLTDEMSHRRGRVQIVSPEDELDNLQLLDIQPAATTTPSSLILLILQILLLMRRDCAIDLHTYRMMIGGGSSTFGVHLRPRIGTKEEDRSEPNRIEMFALTHTRKDGTPVDDHSKEIMDQFQQLLSQPEGTSSSTSASSGASTSVSSTSVASTYVDEIYTQVMGPERHGRVRGYGFGPTPTSIFGSTSRRRSELFFQHNLKTPKRC